MTDDVSTIRLGASALEVGPISYGCWRLAEGDVAAAEANISTALDAGFTLIDTADIYGFDGVDGFGDAEVLLGEVLARNPGLRDRMVLATKAGIRPGVPYDWSAEYLRAACEDSLRRLGVDVIDLYQLHRPDVLTHPGEVAEVLTDLRDRGLVRELGLSNVTPSQFEMVQSHLDVPLVTTQPEFSIWHSDPVSDGTLDQCLVRGVTPLAWSPLGGGQIAAGHRPGRRLAGPARDATWRRPHGDRARVRAGTSEWCCPHHRHAASGSDRRRRDRDDGPPGPLRVVRALSGRHGGAPSMTQPTTARAAAETDPGADPAPPELSWFAALCDDDVEQLGVPAPHLVSSFEHCRDIVLTARDQGFDNILLPSGYQLGIDTLVFAGGVAPEVRGRMQLLAAVRCAEMWPPQLARQLATLDRMLDGGLTINIISSDLPGAPLESEPRYRRTAEVMSILRQLLDGRSIDHHGEFYDLELDPPRIATLRGECPPMYFGGHSEPARRVAAEHADVFLTWPDTEAAVAELVADMTGRAAEHGRSLRIGFRSHVIVRETEAEARAAARHLLAALDAEQGEQIRSRSLDSGSAGVRRQAELREDSDDDGFVEEALWTGIGRARSGAGAAIVGDPDQVVAKLRRYQELGVDAFILSGYPHLAECELVGRHVLPALRAD